MIFITTGTQEPFDRLISAVDETAGIFKSHTFIAQAAASGYEAKNIKVVGFLSPVEFDTIFSSATLIISHAGMGTIISALQKNKPILILPRLAKMKEHRNDHQLATAKEFEKLRYVHTAYSAAELQLKLEFFLSRNPLPLHHIGDFASDSLLNAIREEIKLS